MGYGGNLEQLMRLMITMTSGSRTALPRIVSLLHRRAAEICYLEYRRHGDKVGTVSLEVETSTRSEHLVNAMWRLVEVLDVHEVEVSAVQR